MVVPQSGLKLRRNDDGTVTLISRGDHAHLESSPLDVAVKSEDAAETSCATHPEKDGVRDIELDDLDPHTQAAIKALMRGSFVGNKRVLKKKGCRRSQARGRARFQKTGESRDCNS